mmetsp:Transcript_15835/g.37460  ORF Transcript_15835/g.37460 Transcript_15835/m.37460 type:complete len:192 (+) Transcript_15835:69-644(+)
MKIWTWSAPTLLLLVLLDQVGAGGPVCGNITFDPNRPLIPCCKIPRDFYRCSVLDCTSDPPEPSSFVLGDRTVTCEEGCSRFGAPNWGELDHATARCEVLSDAIDCSGDRVFFYEEFPCERFSGCFFPTAVLLSVFLGWLGADRLYLGHCGLGVLKLLTLGGVGMWWLVDIILLLIGDLRPENGYLWAQGL